MQEKMNKQTKQKEYEVTHLNTYRYKCKSTKNGYPISRFGNYESLLSFKELPAFAELKKNGRKWKYTKNYKPIMDRLVFDIDCADGLEKAFSITKSIMQQFTDIQDCINVYFSGSKGFHIEILTEELDIVDTSVEKPMDSCFQYVEFLNYFQNQYEEVDLSLKDVGTRIIRRHHTKHEKTGNYKILIDVNASLDDILESSKANTDMVNAKSTLLSQDNALNLLKKYSLPIDSRQSSALRVDYADDLSIFSIVYNELNTNIHNKILLIGSGLNGYVSLSELESIYDYLEKNTDIGDSINAKGSFIDAFEDDREQCNLGALKNHYDKQDIDPTNFNRLSKYLNSKLQSKSFKEFTSILESYDYSWFDMLEEELFDYVDNTENIFKGIINSLSALYGYSSRFIVVNGGAEVGKSEYVKTIGKLMPYYKNMGSSTPASIRRQDTYTFDKKIVYLGDKGLKGKDDEEFKGLQEVFGGLITENEFIRDIVVGDKLMEFNLKSEGLCVFYTEPYTNLRVFGAGDQYTTRSTFITVNPVKNGLDVFLQDENSENEFYNIHNNYIRHILSNPKNLKIDSGIKTELYKASNESLRTAKYLLGLFKAYCQYFQIQTPVMQNVTSFLEVFKPKYEVTEIEFLVYEKLYRNLNALTPEDVEYKVMDDGSVETYEDMLLQNKGRKEKSFFTAKQIKTYFKNDLKRNKNLKDTVDQIPEILNNLYNATYLEKLEWQYMNQNVYYIPFNPEMLN